MEFMRSSPDDAASRYFHAARWYLPPMAGEPEPDPTLACTYALLAVYSKLDAIIEAMATNGTVPPDPDVGLDLNAMVRALGWEPPSEIRKGLGHN
jgi:hypothetical protein